jgi:hypothetical protein
MGFDSINALDLDKICPLKELPLAFGPLLHALALSGAFVLGGYKTWGSITKTGDEYAEKLGGARTNATTSMVLGRDW